MGINIKRLKNSASLARMNLTSKNIAIIKKEILRTIKVFTNRFNLHPIPEIYCRVILSRGSGQIGFDTSHIKSLFYVIIAQPCSNVTGDIDFNKGLNLEVSKRIRNDRRALDPAMKSGNYLNSLLAYLEANKNGFDDAILCTRDGFVTEGTTFNIFYVRKSIIATPPSEIGILNGITRDIVIKILSRLKLPLREVYFKKEKLYSSDEVFVTGSVKGIFPVTKIDGKKISNGRIGKITLKLQSEHKELIKRTTLG